jgi:hypothetical protein
LKRFLRSLAEKNEPFFVSFSYDTGTASWEVELFDPEGEDFGSAETGGVKKLEKSAVAKAQGCFWGWGFKNSADLFGG